jgi:ribonucleoside-diphosphate reductase alpha chain
VDRPAVAEPVHRQRLGQEVDVTYRAWYRGLKTTLPPPCPGRLQHREVHHQHRQTECGTNGGNDGLSAAPAKAPDENERRSSALCQRPAIDEPDCDGKGASERRRC